jgi:4,5-DOPA dioxygenase extradiol
MSLNSVLDQFQQAFPLRDDKMPVLFVGHGSPMNALEANEYSRAWQVVGQGLPRPAAILCVSAHWETRGTQVTGMEHPRTIHDFGGFPRALYEMQYPAPGSPQLAGLAQSTVHQAHVAVDQDWGLDHGAWSVLVHLFPQADVPVVQLSLDHFQPPEFHYALAQELVGLRQRGVLILGSGNVVHNLGRVRWQDEAFDWAVEFDQRVKELIEAGDHAALVHYEGLGAAARLSIPTNEHFLPLLYSLAARDEQDTLQFFAERVTLGSLSMRSLRLG